MKIELFIVNIIFLIVGIRLLALFDADNNDFVYGVSFVLFWVVVNLGLLLWYRLPKDPMKKAKKYLNNPITQKEFCEKYNLSEKELLDKIQQGKCKAVECYGQLFVEASNKTEIIIKGR